MTRRHYIAFTFATLVLSACVSSSSTPGLPLPSPGTQAEPSVIASQEARAVKAWRFVPSPDSHSYSSLTTTVITANESPTARHDSSTTQLTYSIVTRQSLDTVSFSGLITEFTLRGQTAQPNEFKPLLPIRFTGRIFNHTVDTELSGSAHSIDANGCVNPSQSVLMGVQRNLFFIPIEVKTEERWTDSTSSVVCSGMLPTSLTIVRSFQVKGESDFNNIPALVLDLNERTFSKGEGSQEQHSILTETQGVTTGRIYIDRVSGQILTTNLTNKTSLSIHSSGRVQKFTQISNQVIRFIY